MKTRIFFSVFIALMVGINMFQAFQIQSTQGSFSLKQLFEANSANAEDIYSYTIKIVIEKGKCDSCCDGIQCTCDCTKFSNYCESGGDDQCDYLTWITIDGECTEDGGPC
jgi:hypothetical protein